MRKIILTAAITLSLTTVGFGYGFQRVGGVSSISSNSFPPPILELAS